jgi:small subunit ribosomal protein S1
MTQENIPDFVSDAGDFASLFEDQASTMKIEFNAGDAVKGKVTLIDSSSIFVNIGARCEGIIPVPELLDRDGQITVEVGDEVDAWVVSDSSGEISLTVKLSGDALNETLEAAFSSGIPVEGKVVEERKGGYTVNLSGNEAFCPYSQMDVRPGDASTYIGQTFSFLITKLEPFGGMVVSRRSLLDAEREKAREELQDSLSEGDEIEGVVRHIEKFGFFVDLGGVDGLVPISEVSWKRTNDITSVVKVGDTVRCAIIALDWDRGRITLSLRECLENPWNAPELLIGAAFNGTVSSVKEFGAFVSVNEGVEGLLHISKFKGLEPAEGDEIQVQIEEIDFESRRISLSLFKGDVEEAQANGPESVFDGKVDAIKPYGVFVVLPDGRSGLMHISQIDVPPSTETGKFLSQHFPVGSEHHVEIIKVENGKLSLAPAGKKQSSRETQAMLQNLHKQSDGGSFGSLGGMFDGIDL